MKVQVAATVRIRDTETSLSWEYGARVRDAYAAAGIHDTVHVTGPVRRLRFGTLLVTRSGVGTYAVTFLDRAGVMDDARVKERTFGTLIEAEQFLGELGRECP